MTATRKTAFYSLVMCLAGWTSASYAQSFPPAPGPGPGPGDAAPGVFDPGNAGIGYAVSPPFGPWVGFDGRFGDGIGWKDGYYGGNVFIPRHIDPGISLMFTQVNLSGTSGGSGVVNVGSGYRYRNPSMNRIFGLSGWFDYDDGHEEGYSRVGLSFETMGKYMDARLNTYYVLGNDHNKTAEYITDGPFFQTNYLWLTKQQVWENAYSGADFEVGGPIPFIGRYGLSGYIGPYWLHHEEDEDVVGAKVRLMAQINDDLSIGAQFSNDDVFSNNAYFNVQYTIPDGRPSRWFRPTPVRERLAQQVVREYRVPTHTKVETSTEPLINPADLQPLTFAFINPNAVGPGIGTFENPYGSTAAFVNQPGYDIIMVRPGNPNNLNTGLALLNNQRLLSTTVTHQITTLQGSYTIPLFDAANSPILSNPNLVGAGVVQLANNNEVSGFQIDGSNGVNPIIQGIVSQPGGIAGFNINRNSFTNSSDAVALYVTGSGYGRFVNNTLTGDGLAVGTSLSSRGFAVRSDGAGTVLNLLVANNTASGFVGPYEDGNRNGIFDPGEDTVSLLNPGLAGGNGNGVFDQGTAFEITAAGGSVINANAPAAALPTGILNNVETASGTGLLLNGVAAGNLNAVVLNNSFQNNVTTNTGMRAVANGGVISLDSVAFNVITGNNGNGLALLTRNFGVIDASITNNVITNNSLAQVLLDANDLTIADNGAITINAFTDNTLDRTTAGTAGILINSVNADITLNNVLRNQFTAANTLGTRSFGIGGTVRSGTLNAVIGDGTLANQNFFTNNRSAAIGFNLEGDVVADVRVLRNTITGTTQGVPAIAGFAGDGIKLNLTDDAVLADTSIIDLNTITGSTGFGIGVRSLLNSTVTGMMITRNAITGGTADGINFLRQQQGNIVDVFITDNVISGNTGATSDGIDISAEARNVLDTYRIARNAITGNGGRGIGQNVANEADLFVEIFNNTITGNVSHGIQNTENVTQAIDTRSYTGVILGNTISGQTAGRGISLNGVYTVQIGDEGVDADGFSLGNLIQNNNLAGIFSDAVGDAIVRNNQITGNGAGLAANEGAGIDLNSTLVSGNNWVIDLNNISNNRGDGVEVLASTATRVIPDDDVVVTNVAITRNNITANDARGIDWLSRGDTLASLTIGGAAAADGNFISGNLLEGVYIVFTSSVTQVQNNLATVALAADGVVAGPPTAFATPLPRGHLDLLVQNNQVNGNGTNSLFNSTGLVLRVGTSDTDGSNPVNGRQFANSVDGSGVVATIDNNEFLGNRTNDVFFGSFVSTLAPTDAQFDPMARLDLIFSNNTVGALNSIGSTAAYTNASTVKSSASVFTSTARPRNATLLPADILSVATGMAVVDDTPTAGAIAPGAAAFQTTLGTSSGVAGIYNSLATNASEFQTRFITGVNAGIPSTIATYATPVIGGTPRRQFNVNPAYPAAPAVGDTLVVDYLRIPGIGTDTTAAAIAAGTAGLVTPFGTFRVQTFGNTIGINTVSGVAGGQGFFVDAVQNLNPTIFDPAGTPFDRPFVWDTLP